MDDQFSGPPQPLQQRQWKSLYAELNRQKDLKRTYRRRYKDLQAVVTMTTNTPVTVTNSKINPSPQVTKAALEGQGKKTTDKGKAIKHLGKGKKNVAKSNTNVVTVAGPSVSLCSNLKDRAKHTATLIQEITEELQAIKEESLKEEQDSEDTQESDLDQEDSDNLLTDGEQ